MYTLPSPLMTPYCAIIATVLNDASNVFYSCDRLKRPPVPIALTGYVLLILLLTVLLTMVLMVILLMTVLCCTDACFLCDISVVLLIPYLRGTVYCFTILAPINYILQYILPGYDPDNIRLPTSMTVFSIVIFLRCLPEARCLFVWYRIIRWQFLQFDWYDTLQLLFWWLPSLRILHFVCCPVPVATNTNCLYKPDIVLRYRVGRHRHFDTKHTFILWAVDVLFLLFYWYTCRLTLLHAVDVPLPSPDDRDIRDRWYYVYLSSRCLPVLIVGDRGDVSSDLRIFFFALSNIWRHYLFMRWSTRGDLWLFVMTFRVLLLFHLRYLLEIVCFDVCVIGDYSASPWHYDVDLRGAWFAVILLLSMMRWTYDIVACWTYDANIWYHRDAWPHSWWLVYAVWNNSDVAFDCLCFCNAIPRLTMTTCIVSMATYDWWSAWYSVTPIGVHTYSKTCLCYCDDMYYRWRDC